MNRAMMLNATLGDYRVTDFVGAGGMGEVYRAVHARVGHAVALKVLTETDDQTDVRRFLEEARIQSQRGSSSPSSLRRQAPHGRSSSKRRRAPPRSIATAVAAISAQPTSASMQTSANRSSCD